MTGRPVEDPEDRRPGTQPVARVGSGRALPFLAGAVVAAVVLLILKPWATDPSPRASGTARGETSSAPPTSRASRSPAATRPAVAGSIPCISEVDWRVVTVERTAGRESRSWIALEPRVARGPRDASVPRIRVTAGRLRGLGFCAPAAVEASVSRVVVSRLIGSGASVRAETQAGLTEFAPPGPAAATVLTPPRGAAAWAPGRYVFLVAVGPRQLGFAIDVAQARSDGGG